MADVPPPPRTAQSFPVPDREKLGGSSDEELLDIYDDLGGHVGVKGRTAAHRDGDWHRCVHLWVVSGDAVLLQRRGGHKASWPGALDATAAGHVAAGESVEGGGAREIAEELGVAFAGEQLVSLGVRAIVDRSGGLVNREFQHVLLARDDRPLEAWTDLEWAELDGLVRMKLPTFSELVHGPGRGPWPAEAWGGERVTVVEIARDEVIPGSYLPVLTVMLERFARGERPLAI